jgi:hypothetical protein
MKPDYWQAYGWLAVVVTCRRMSSYARTMSSLEGESPPKTPVANVPLLPGLTSALMPQQHEEQETESAAGGNVWGPIICPRPESLHGVDREVTVL